MTPYRDAKMRMHFRHGDCRFTTADAMDRRVSVFATCCVGCDPLCERPIDALIWRRLDSDGVWRTV